MFARLYNSIREIVNRDTEHTTNKKHLEVPPNEHIDSGRRSSVTEELQKQDTHNMFAGDHTGATALDRRNSVGSAGPMDIRNPMSRRRSSSIFNISNITADDYVQKDLISSSWS